MTTGGKHKLEIASPETTQTPAIGCTNGYWRDVNWTNWSYFYENTAHGAVYRGSVRFDSTRACFVAIVAGVMPWGTSELGTTQTREEAKALVECGPALLLLEGKTKWN